MKILSEQGFKNFEGFVSQGIASSLLRIFFSEDSSIDCTEDHKFLMEDNFFKEAKDIHVGDKLYPNVPIIDKNLIPFPEGIEIFDALNVEDTHSFMTNGIISHNCNVIFLDEFAFVERATEFYTSTYPVISSGKNTKVIITSTANGLGNQFYKIWEGATNGSNEFKPFRIDWWDVPGRDETWKKQTIANTSENQFRQEFCLSGDSKIDISINNSKKFVGELRNYAQSL